MECCLIAVAMLIILQAGPVVWVRFHTEQYEFGEESQEAENEEPTVED